ncbi:MAG: flagellin B [Campylobacterales bacterium]|nr:flagellin B [Campylobacterales bacterium]
MGFRINTNIAAMNAHAASALNNRNLDSSLSKLSSGLRINSAADDASGMAIADSLRSQASALGQAIANANDGVGMAQIADKAMDEQIQILDRIKTKATQSAQEGQSAESRKALQADIKRLVESLDNIAGTTSFNGKALLSGQFTNASFQVGAYSNQTINMSIGATSSDKIGQTRFETSAVETTLAAVTATYTDAEGNATALEAVVMSTSAGTGIGALAEVINKNSDLTGVKASWTNVMTGTAVIAPGTVTNLTINGTVVASSLDVKDNDSSGVLVDAINQFTTTTGVQASTDERGRLELTSTDGRAIQVSGLGTVGLIADGNQVGRLTMTKLGAADINMSFTGAFTGAFTNASIGLRDMMSELTNTEAIAMGAVANANVINASQTLSAGVTTYAGAQAMISVAESATRTLDKIRSDIGSAQNQMTSTINNITITQVNVKAAESQIRDVDFAAESANFSKFNILAQSGSYAMSQANSVQQNVLRLLQ